MDGPGRPTAAGDDDDRIVGLEASIEGLQQELVRQRSLLIEARAATRKEAAELKRVRRDYDRLRGRRIVRLAVAISRQLRPIVGAARKLMAAPRRSVRSVRRRWRDRARARALRASRRKERTLLSALRRSLPPSTVDHGPLVSIVILNRDGRAHLERCLRALSTTAYRDVEIILVDNGSTDGSIELAEGTTLPFPLRVIRNAENRSFSEANGQGVAAASGPLICFLNNDVDPITDDWLGYLVETLTATGAAAVGARLIYPRHRGGPRAGARFADLTLQHRGVAFDRAGPIPMPQVLGAGEDPTSPAAGAVTDRPALTAACLLVDRAAYEGVGGFSTEFDYGLEDVDLCLKLRLAGRRLVYDGRSSSWHHESATRVVDDEARRARREHNREAFVGRWGPWIHREALLDAIDGGTSFTDAPLHVAITTTTRDGLVGRDDALDAAGLGDALATFGWRVTSLDPTPDGWSEPESSVDVVLTMQHDLDIRRLPRHLVTIALIAGDPGPWLARPWFDDLDIVLATTEPIATEVRARRAKVASLLPTEGRATAIRTALVTWTSATRVGIRVGVPSWDVAESWGDHHFGRALQRSLERAGHPTRIHLLPEWGTPVAAREDVSVHLFGLKAAPTHPAQVNVLWQISHPDLATPEMYDRYDQVFVASDPFAARMAGLTRVPVASLHQATDPERFQPDPTGPHHELLFVANSRGVRRRIVDDLAGTTYDLAVYGTRWRPELIDPRYVKGDGIPNAEVGRYYSSASVVLNDHWDDMRANAFISNRIYDALACGAFVISDRIDGIEAEFDGAVVTYRDRAELTRLLRRYLPDEAARRQLGERGRAAVLARHTFDVRARTLMDAAMAIAPKRPQ